MNGQPATVIAVEGNGIEYNEGNLRNIITRCDSRPIVIVAVAGDFRKGKSFLLNIFLRYLHHSANNTSWLSHLNGTVDGFKSSGGCMRVTQGISFWSEPFFLNKNGEEIAVILCDSQGLFDNKTPSKINSLIFGFSAVVPSLVIYNLKANIDEKSLDSLASFAPKMGKLGSFQHLMFLIRDWNDEERYPCGLRGGKQYLDNILGETNDQQLNNTRSIIKKWFPSINGFLLPFPGTHVALSKTNSQIDMSKVEQDFIMFSDQLCYQIFDADIQIKKREGRYMKGEDILTFVSYLVQQFKAGKIDDPGTHWEGDSKRICGASKDECVWAYKQWMPERLVEEKENTNEAYVSDSFLEQIHHQLKNGAIERYSNATGIYPNHDEFKNQLERDIEEEFKLRVSENTEIRRRREEEVRRQNAEEAERIAKIELEQNQREKERMEEEHRREMKEAEERREQEIREQQKRHEKEIQEAKKQRGHWFEKVIGAVIGSVAGPVVGVISKGFKMIGL